MAESPEPNDVHIVLPADGRTSRVTLEQQQVAPEQDRPVLGPGLFLMGNSLTFMSLS